MLARWVDGLPADEVNPLGFRMLRIRASAVEVVPSRFAQAVRGLADLATGIAYRVPRIGPVAAEVERRARILLTIRSHRKAALVGAPAGDLYHGMAFMGIPVALDLGQRDGVPVVYDARDIYLDAAQPGPDGPRSAAGSSRGSERGWARRASTRVITVNDVTPTCLQGAGRSRRPLVVMNCSYRFTPPVPRERRFHERSAWTPPTRSSCTTAAFPVARHRAADRGDPRRVPRRHAGADGLRRPWRPSFAAREADPGTRRPRPGHGRGPAGRAARLGRRADVAAMPIQGDTLNHRLTTPNKLFEAMAAGVPAVVSRPARDARDRRARRAAGSWSTRPTRPRSRTPSGGSLDLPEAEWLAWRAALPRRRRIRTYNWETQVECLLDEYGTTHGQAMVNARPNEAPTRGRSSWATPRIRTRGRSASGAR